MNNLDINIDINLLIPLGEICGAKVYALYVKGVLQAIVKGDSLFEDSFVTTVDYLEKHSCTIAGTLPKVDGSVYKGCGVMEDF
jgi:hypothetical protein